MLPALRAAGHEPHAVTGTGFGARAHLRDPGITLRAHIADAVGLVDAEELTDIVLVGHSCGGQEITGAADALAGRIKHLIYVDAMVPLPGEGWGNKHRPEVVAARKAAAAANDNALPQPSATSLRPLPRGDAFRRSALAPLASRLHGLQQTRSSGDRWIAPVRAHTRAHARGRGRGRARRLDDRRVPHRALPYGLDAGGGRAMLACACQQIVW